MGRLQRGRVPEHAESRRSGGSRAEGAFGLQRGRVPEHAESHHEAPAHGPLQAASTRPRAGARGEQVIEQASSLGPARASTRPRAGARGEGCGAYRPWHDRVLQRGRVPEHAESCTEPSAPCAAKRSFNEAACRSTRRDDLSVADALDIAMASTRPRAGARGEFRRRGQQAAVEGASTRPRAGARGEQRPLVGDAPNHSRFNEAACRSTRRDTGLGDDGDRAAWLQRGRVPEHAERQRTQGRHFCPQGLQRGRVPEHAERALP